MSAERRERIMKGTAAVEGDSERPGEGGLAAPSRDLSIPAGLPPEINEHMEFLAGEVLRMKGYLDAADKAMGRLLENRDSILEEAAKVADRVASEWEDVAAQATLGIKGAAPSSVQGGRARTARSIAMKIRKLKSPSGGHGGFA